MEPIKPTVICPNCAGTLHAGDETCPHCQSSVDQEISSPPQNPDSGLSAVREFADKRWLVLAVLFGATAAFGLPVLWMSRGFSRTQKVLLTIVVLFYTALILWLIEVVFGHLMNQLAELWKVLS